MSNNNEVNINVSPEEEVEKFVDTITENTEYKHFNFLINASNQANLIDTYNMSSVQANVLFVLIQPCYIDSISMEDINLNIKMNENNSIVINDREFEAVEIQPGIRVFGINKNSEE